MYLSKWMKRYRRTAEMQVIRDLYCKNRRRNDRQRWRGHIKRVGSRGIDDQKPLEGPRRLVMVVNNRSDHCQDLMDKEHRQRDEEMSTRTSSLACPAASRAATLSRFETMFLIHLVKRLGDSGLWFRIKWLSVSLAAASSRFGFVWVV